nr:InlB B-repeat-containing protein [Candidatus Enterousia merdequi]
MKNIIKYCAIGCALMAINGAYAWEQETDSGYTCSEFDEQNDCVGEYIICPVGYYCPEETHQQIQCPDGKTSQIGALSESECYASDALTIEQGTTNTLTDETVGTADDGAIVTASPEWEANTININWKDANGDTFETTTCQYDGNITVPTTAPAKKGYTFVGWKSQYHEDLLEQARLSMQEQANQQPQGILDLLG